MSTTFSCSTALVAHVREGADMDEPHFFHAAPRYLGLAAKSQHRPSESLVVQGLVNTTCKVCVPHRNDILSS